GARALHAHLEGPHAEGFRGVARGDRRLRRRKRRPLARSLEADAAGARPRHHVPLGIGDGDRRVVERRVDVREPVVDDALLAALLERLLLRRASRGLLAPFGGRRGVRIGCCFLFGHSLCRCQLPVTSYQLPVASCQISGFRSGNWKLATGHYTVFFFAIAPLRGPFRVRALVFVRCPRTGRLRRCRIPPPPPTFILPLLLRGV